MPRKRKVIKRYPFAPLEEILRGRAGTTLSQRALEKTLGVTSGRVDTFRRKGITADLADEFATRLDLEESEIWPDIDDEIMVQCGSPPCEKKFVPYRPNHKYCCKAHMRREETRRYRRTPQGREINLRHSRAYYASLGPAARRELFQRLERHRKERARRRREQEEGS